MESMHFDFSLTGNKTVGKKTVCGVVGSGNLEVIIEENNSNDTDFTIETSVANFKPIWELVISDFVKEYQPIGLRFTLNDNGATPAVVSLRLRQALEMYQGFQPQGQNYLELGARERINNLVDSNSFNEWLVQTPHYSPHLAALDLPGQADDGIVIGAALLNQQKILIAAQQKEFMGGAVGEVHGAKLTGLFKAAVKLKPVAVILLIDSGGVRLHEANAGEIAISEAIRAIFEARAAGVKTIGVVAGKNGAYGGMGILCACLDTIIINEVGRIGVSGAEVIQAVKGVEAFNAQDRALVWRVYGGKTRYLQGMANDYVDNLINDIKQAIEKAMTLTVPITLESLQIKHKQLGQRLQNTADFQEEGQYLQKYFPLLAPNLFEMDESNFLKAAVAIKTQSGVTDDWN